MQLRPGTFGMTAMLAMLIALGPLSTDMYLPSLPSIAAALETETSSVQLTLSVYLVGFAAGQIFYGPVSDKIGRKPAVLFGLGLYCLASAACALAQSIEVLIAARFVQALGAAGPIVLGRAIVRDIYEGPAAGRELSRMGMVMGLVPALAPIIGGFLEPLFGWRSNFWAVLAASALLAASVAALLPETLRQARPEPISLREILRGFGVLLAHAGYRRYVLLAGLTYAGLFSFISGSSFVLQRVYGLAPFAFGLSFGASVIGFITGTIIAQRIVMKRGMDGTIAIGVACLAGGGMLMLALMMIGTGSSLEVTVPMALYAMGVGLVLPQANASAMMPFPDRAGAASSLQGLVQMSFAAIVGAALGHFLDSSALLMPAFISAMGLAALFVFHSSRHWSRQAG
ncbi:MAG: multidrug effflux MFS transporter [Methylocystis sp.]|nr:multidrug effflux MFS transporter [Methylocystis sp.]MCA3583197.1 multidrug effflux MFS transporter [Methylocystis sp.]MCA3587598.1 multidrug effflux MFS transporter [Methylocystis sp.]MCA3590725.1 multidrug effflux MFS transporter [Methylocystis sp.]